MNECMVVGKSTGLGRWLGSANLPDPAPHLTKAPPPQSFVRLVVK